MSTPWPCTASARADGRNVSLTGVVGRLLEPACAFAEEFGAALATTDLDELLAEPRVDAVIVCSPTDLRGADRARPARRQARPLRDPGYLAGRDGSAYWFGGASGLR